MNYFQSSYGNKIFDAPHRSYTRANLFTDRIDKTVPAKVFIYVNLYIVTYVH